MGTVKNLYDYAAIKKMQQLIDSSSICLFATQLSEAPLSVRPMGTLKVDDDGFIWFFSNKSSRKNKEIDNDHRVQLFYSNNSGSEYLSVYGEAEINSDKGKIDELWKPIAKAWFNEGKDDPQISVIKIKPEQAYYWDTKHNKMVSLLKIIAGALTGVAMDDGVEGQIKL